MSDARRIRSPNYPAISLPEAITRIGVVYERERQHPMSRDVALKGLGYSSPNGAALGTLSAVTKYGLLDKTGDSYRVSDRTLAILHPKDPGEKAEALRQSAFAPALFAELAEQFPGGQVSDDNLRSYLMRNGFSSGSLSSVISAFRETMQVVSSAEEKTPSPLALPTPAMSTAPEARPAHASMQTAVSTGTVFAAPPWGIALGGGLLKVSAELSNAKAVDELIRTLQAVKPLLPKDDEQRTPEASGDEASQ